MYDHNSYFFHDKRLDMGAIGLLIALLYGNNDIECSIEGLNKLSSDSIEETRAYFKTLVDCGYVHVIVNEDCNGNVYNTYEVFDTPHQKKK